MNKFSDWCKNHRFELGLAMGVGFGLIFAPTKAFEANAYMQLLKLQTKAINEFLEIKGIDHKEFPQLEW